jgi:hypothetical protein
MQNNANKRSFVLCLTITLPCVAHREEPEPAITDSLMRMFNDFHLLISGTWHFSHGQIYVVFSKSDTTYKVHRIFKAVVAYLYKYLLHPTHARSFVSILMFSNIYIWCVSSCNLLHCFHGAFERGHVTVHAIFRLWVICRMCNETYVKCIPYTEVLCIPYTEVFFPVVNFSSICSAVRTFVMAVIFFNKENYSSCCFCIIIYQ